MMRQSLKLMGVGLGVAGLTLSLAASPALALSLQGNYFTLLPGHIDTGANVAIDGATVPNLTLAPLSGVPGTVGAAPFVNPAAPAHPSGSIENVNGAGAIQWWTAQAGVVAIDASVGVGGQRSDAFVGNTLGGVGFASNFFPAGNANNAAGFRAVHWTGSFTVGVGGATATLSADDDAWLFLNGARVLDNGGIKAIGLSTTDTEPLLPGNYIVDLFFADRFQFQSGIVFTLAGDIDPIPEPATLLLFGTTLAGIGAVIRRRMKGQKEVA